MARAVALRLRLPQPDAVRLHGLGQLRVCGRVAAAARSRPAPGRVSDADRSVSLRSADSGILDDLGDRALGALSVQRFARGIRLLPGAGAPGGRNRSGAAGRRNRADTVAGLRRALAFLRVVRRSRRKPQRFRRFTVRGALQPLRRRDVRCAVPPDRGDGLDRAGRRAAPRGLRLFLGRRRSSVC